MIYNLVQQITKGVEVLRLIPQIILCISMIIGSFIMPKVLRAYQKRRAKRKRKEYIEKYTEYLDKTNKKIQDELKHQVQVLKENNLSIRECSNAILNKNRHFWSKDISDDDFLRIRLGIGEINSYVMVNAPKEHFTISLNELQEKVFEVAKNSKKLKDAPVVLNLADQSVVSFIVNCSYSSDYINGLLTQIVALQNPLDLKIVIMTSAKNESKWEFAKKLPHCWSDEKNIRFFACNSEEYKELAHYFEEIVKSRMEALRAEEASEEAKSEESKEYKKFPPYYLIITDDYNSIKRLPMIENLQKVSKNVGFTLFTISDSMKNLPSKCSKFVIIGEKESCILDKRMSSQSQIVFTNECEKGIDMELLSVRLSNVPVLTKEGLSVLPSSLTFLDMYGVGKIEQLNIFNRWKLNNPTMSLAAPIGVHEDGEQFKLDLHEKVHGPHGLIAGSTGSGKSEFIITYILSMCVNFHPYEVQFVLIDYKGGGLAGAFENKESGVKVPHLVGTITNLDTAEMNRTLVSISSELKRRQKKFNEVKDKLDESTMDIYKYQKLYREGLIDEPMAHLFIISDEFAELKSQQPEFLDELVSTARTGRSLGVHLILATQKPSGVVSDQIWSNSKFKVCLKVQDRGDSMEMLKRPEAASIKEPGRFYLQIGYDDYFDIGQSGWGGAKYVPTDKKVQKYDDTISFVNNTGNVIKSINNIVKKENTVELGEQVTNIVKFIYTLSNKENIKTRKMWLDKIPEKIFIKDIKEKYNYTPRPYFINPVIGEVDIPAAQAQTILNVNLHKNVIIYGKSGSGKENLVSTIIWSSIIEHRPEEVNFYIIDCGAGTLKMFHKLPHVGEVMEQDERNKIIDTLSMVDQEIARRKEAYADYAGSWENYCESSGQRDPIMVVIINNYDVFGETYSKFLEKMDILYRDGAKYGVTFIITCLASNTVREKVSQLFGEKIALQMPKQEDYRTVMEAPKGLIPYSAFGRGLIAKEDTALEFQTALIAEIKQINVVVREATQKLNEAYTVRAKRIPTIPPIVTLDTLKVDNLSLSNLPVGYNMKTKTVHSFDFERNKISCIVSENMAARLDFIRVLFKQLQMIPNVSVRIIDLVEAFADPIDGIPIYNSNFDNSIITVNNEVVSGENQDAMKVYIFFGIGMYESKFGEGAKQVFNKLVAGMDAISKSRFIFVDNYSSIKNLQLAGWYSKQISPNDGIWLGPNIANQMIFQIPNVGIDVRNLDFPCMGFALSKGEMTIMKYAVDVVGEENEK